MAWAAYGRYFATAWNERGCHELLDAEIHCGG